MKILPIKDGEKVKKTGIYQMSNAWYHSDCAVKPSFSSSMAKVLYQECPASLYYDSYLNKKRVKKPNSRFDLGTAAHAAILEKDWTKHVVVMAKEASKPRKKFLKNQAESAGAVSLTKEQMQRVLAARDSFMADKELAEMVTAGQNELSYFYQDEATGLFLKVRPDVRIRRNDGVHVHEFKSSQGSSAVGAVQYRMMDLAWFVQAAAQLDVMERVEGARPVHYSWMCQESAPPHLANIVVPDELVIEWGKIVWNWAIAEFAKCLKANAWPGYPRHGVAELPRGAEMNLEERKNRGEFGAHMRVEEGVARRVFGFGNDPKTLEAY